MATDVYRIILFNLADPVATSQATLNALWDQGFVLVLAFVNGAQVVTVFARAQANH